MAKRMPDEPYGLEEQIRTFLSSEESYLHDFLEELHRHPELSGEEVWTTQYIEMALIQAGLKPQRLPRTGLICDIGPGNGKILAIRADIDALPIEEGPKATCRSQIPGVSHACGHDYHTIIVLGVGLLLARLAKEGKLRTTVRLVFQPSEETGEGAAQVVQAGWTDGVDRILGMHCFPNLRSGQLGLVKGPVNAACDTLTITLFGPGGHTSRPYETVDLVDQLCGVVKTSKQLAAGVDPRYPTLLTYGKIHAGTADNIIPTSGYCGGTLRYVNEVTALRLENQIQEHLRYLESFGLRTSFDVKRDLPPVINDDDLWESLRGVVTQMNAEAVFPLMSMGGDDFGVYPLPKFYVLLGTGPGPDLHTPDFEVPWPVVPSAIEFFVRALLALA